jgi:hypothetical protein
MSFEIWEALEVTGQDRENLAYSLLFSPPVVTYACFPEIATQNKGEKKCKQRV